MIRITTGLKASDHWCLDERLPESGGPVLFAGQKPYPTWPQAPPPDELLRDPPAREKAAVMSAAVSPEPRRSLVLPIVLGIGGFGVVAVGLLGFLVSLTASRPGAAENRRRLAGARGCAASFGGSSFKFRSDDQSRGAARKARTAADPNRPSSRGQPRGRAAARVDDACRSAAIAPRSRAGNRPRARAASSAARMSAAPGPTTSYDQTTAVYDISAHTVYLPDSMRLEAHSGLGGRLAVWRRARIAARDDLMRSPRGRFTVLKLREAAAHIRPVGTVPQARTRALKPAQPNCRVRGCPSGRDI